MNELEKKIHDILYANIPAYPIKVEKLIADLFRESAAIAGKETMERDGTCDVTGMLYELYALGRAHEEIGTDHAAVQMIVTKMADRIEAARREASHGLAVAKAAYAASLERVRQEGEYAKREAVAEAVAKIGDEIDRNVRYPQDGGDAYIDRAGIMVIQDYIRSLNAALRREIGTQAAENVPIADDTANGVATDKSKPKA